MTDVQLTWTPNDAGRAQSILRQTWSQSGYGAGERPRRLVELNHDVARACVQTMIAAQELVNIGHEYQKLRSGALTPEGLSAFLKQLSRGVPPTAGGDLGLGVFLGPGYRDMYLLAIGTVTDVYRSGMPVKIPEPVLFPGGVQDIADAELGALPVIATVITILGITGTAAYTWWAVSREEERRKMWVAVETEKAWALARSFSEIEANKMRVAQGKDPIVSDWASTRARVEQVRQSQWTDVALIGAAGIVAAAGIWGFFTRQPAAAPARANPRPRPALPAARPRPKPKAKAAAGPSRPRAKPKDKPRAKPKPKAKATTKPKPKPKAKPKAAPKRKANPIKAGYSRATMSKNIAELRRAGRPAHQASAIAYRSARSAWEKKHGRKPYPAHLAKRGAAAKPKPKPKPRAKPKAKAKPKARTKPKAKRISKAEYVAKLKKKGRTPKQIAGLWKGVQAARKKGRTR